MLNGWGFKLVGGSPTHPVGVDGVVRFSKKSLWVSWRVRGRWER